MDKILLPVALCGDVLIIFGQIDIDDVVLLRPADAVLKGQRERLFMLAEMPEIRLCPREAVALNAELDCVYFSVIREMMRSRTALSGSVLFSVTTLRRRSLSILKLLRPCSKVMPNTSFVSISAGT